MESGRVGFPFTYCAGPQERIVTLDKSTGYWRLKD